MSDASSDPIANPVSDTTAAIGKVLPPEQRPSGAPDFKKLPERVADDGTLPPYLPDRDLPVPEGHVRADQLGPGDTIFVAVQIHATVWDQQGFIWVQTADGRRYGPYGKSSAVRVS